MRCCAQCSTSLYGVEQTALKDRAYGLATTDKTSVATSCGCVSKKSKQLERLLEAHVFIVICSVECAYTCGIQSHHLLRANWQDKESRLHSNCL